MSFMVAAPEMTLLGLICIVLVADLFVEQERLIITFWMALASLGITLWVLLATAPAGRMEVFSGSYVSDGLSQVLKLSVTGFVAIAFIYARDYLRANDLHKGEFGLACGAVTLLNTTRLQLKRNLLYGLLGPSNCGKTTLMRAIERTGKQIEGFPKRDELRTIFVEHDMQEREVGEDEGKFRTLNND